MRHRRRTRHAATLAAATCGGAGTTHAGRVEAIPSRPEFCAASPAPTAKGPFREPEAAVQDPRGSLWVSDGCTLSRMAPDGAVTQVLGEGQMCPTGEPEKWIRGEFLAWDVATSGCRASCPGSRCSC